MHAVEPARGNFCPCIRPGRRLGQRLRLPPSKTTTACQKDGVRGEPQAPRLALPRGPAGAPRERRVRESGALGVFDTCLVIGLRSGERRARAVVGRVGRPRREAGAPCAPPPWGSTRRPSAPHRFRANSPTDGIRPRGARLRRASCGGCPPGRPFRPAPTPAAVDGAEAPRRPPRPRLRLPLRRAGRNARHGVRGRNCAAL
jgi:hypothetical protein